MKQSPARLAKREQFIAEVARALCGVRPLPADGISGLVNDREVRVENARGVSSDWVVVRAVICMASELDSERVLERNARLAFATIVLANGFYWLRVALPTDSDELADTRRVIDLVVDGAAQLAPRPTFSMSAAFAHYAI